MSFGVHPGSNSQEPGCDQASHNAGQPAAGLAKTTGDEKPLDYMQFETHDSTSSFDPNRQVVATRSGKPSFAVSMRSLDLC
jgi:hypothetical protein